MFTHTENDLCHCDTELHRKQQNVASAFNPAGGSSVLRGTLSGDSASQWNLGG